MEFDDIIKDFTSAVRGIEAELRRPRRVKPFVLQLPHPLMVLLWIHTL